jgi:opacity protein-like surface antigen
MKKFALLCLMTLGLMSTTMSSQAQDKKKSSPSYISIGPVVGIGLSWVTDAANNDANISPLFGVRGIWSKKEHWGISAELAVTMEGTNGKIALTNTDWKAVPTYVRFTPAFNYFFMDYKSNVRPKLYAGPTLGFKVGESYIINDNKVNNATEMFKPMDFGFTFGGGANFKLSQRIWLNLDASFFTTVMPTTETGDHFGQNARINVGVLFGI